MSVQFLNNGGVLAVLAAEDVADLSQYPDKTVQAVGGTVTLEGSMDGTAYAPLTTQTEDGPEAIELADGEIAFIREHTVYVRNAEGATGEAYILAVR